MKCPLCGYQHGYEWVEDTHQNVVGEDGDFYHSPVKLERSELFGPDESVRMYGCPSCKGTFIDD